MNPNKVKKLWWKVSRNKLWFCKHKTEYNIMSYKQLKFLDYKTAWWKWCDLNQNNAFLQVHCSCRNKDLMLLLTTRFFMVTTIFIIIVYMEFFNHGHHNFSWGNSIWRCNLNYCNLHVKRSNKIKSWMTQSWGSLGVLSVISCIMIFFPSLKWLKIHCLWFDEQAIFKLLLFNETTKAKLPYRT